MLIAVAVACVIAALAVMVALLSRPNPHPKTIEVKGYSSSDVNVPSEYQQLYSDYDKGLAELDSYLSSRLKGKKYPITFGAELLVANANRGTDLLSPYAKPGVAAYLDRFQQLGIQGVTVCVGYPLFTPGFKNYSRYVSFYRQVAQEVRKRGMKMDVEAFVLFANTPFSGIEADYAGLTFDQFKKEVLQMDQTIIDELSPDYLNICGEPDTEASLLDMPELNDPDRFAEFVKFVTDGLDKRNTLVGAGGSSWKPIFFNQRLAQNPSLDFLSIHIYPIGTSIITNVIQTAELAREHGKRVVMDEIWLYKAGKGEMVTGLAGNDKIYGRDVFSFWQPLDQRFLKAMVDLANLEQIEYVSPFWVNYFFSYIGYNEQIGNLPYSQLVKTANKAAAANIRDGKFSLTGQYYRELIVGNQP
jgi:hypothetical protein